MANISKNIFDPAKQFLQVVFQRDSPVMDFDWNDHVDLTVAAQERALAQMAEGATVLGGAGWITPNVAARRVNVAAGVSSWAGKTLRIPALTALQVFNDATVSGTVTSLVYVETWDDEVLFAQDPAIGESPGVGETQARKRRNVLVKAAFGTTVVPVVAGRTTFLWATITHNFTTDGTAVLAKDIAMAPTAPTPGELAGRGPARTLALFSAALAVGSTAVAHVADTTVNHAAGKLWSLRNFGVEKASVDWAGNLLCGLVNNVNLADVGNASALVTGTVADARLSGNVAFRNLANIFTVAQVIEGASGTLIQGLRVPADADFRFGVLGSGQLQWGSGAAGQRDTNLYRSAANVLRTDDAFQVALDLTAEKNLAILGQIWSSRHAYAAGVAAINFNDSNNVAVTLTANAALSFANGVAGGVYVVEVRQDATGGRVPVWPATVRWPGGTAPTLSTAPNAFDIMTFYYNGTVYAGVVSGLGY